MMNRREGCVVSGSHEMCQLCSSVTMIDDTTGVLEYVYVFCFMVEVGLVSKVSVWYYVVYYVCWVASPRTSSILGVSLGAAHNNNLDSRFIYQV